MFHRPNGQTGIGVLWGRTELLDAMPPFLEAANILDVEDGLLTNCHKFEAGTPPIAEIIGLGGHRISHSIGMTNIRNHEIELTNYTSTLTTRYGDDIVIHIERYVVAVRMSVEYRCTPRRPGPRSAWDLRESRTSLR